MAQSTVLAPGNAAGSSSTITVASGSTVTVALFVASGFVPSNAQFNLVQKTPGADLPLTTPIGPQAPRVVLSTPGSYAVNRVTGGSTFAAGGLPDGLYAYVVTALNAAGETLKSNERTVFATNSTNLITVTWAAVTGATGYKVYRGGTAGGENLVQTLGAVTTLADNGSGWTAGTVPGTNTTALTAPVQAATATATTGGTLAAATYYYVVTATNAVGETLVSNERSQVTTGSTSTVTVNWAAVTGATGYRIYRGTAAGAEGTYYVVGAVTTFTDTGAAGTAGTPPVTNTTGLAAPVQSALAASAGVTTLGSVGVFTET